MRLFVGGELPAAVREALAGWARDVPARRLPAESLHVTLFFLGERQDDPRDGLLALPGGAVALRTTGAAWLGSALAVELADETGALARLYACGFPGWTAERRGMRPHVTVARAARRGERPALPSQPPPALAFGLEAVVLFRSHPGSRYEPLARRMLAAPTG